ncbi:MAG: cupin domain-containing protein [Pseudohongiellaceae bacterium]|jgi:quercetin dioxygenase-like cupin family protein
MPQNSLYPDLINQLPAFEGPFDARKLEARNCDVLFASYPAGTSIPEHQHDTENVGIITRGVLLLTMDGQQQRISAGQWYHVPANKPHAADFPEETAEIEFWFKPQESTD